MLKPPNTVAHFVEYVGKSSAKNHPVEWFKAHEAFTRPIVTELARKSGAIGEPSSGSARWTRPIGRRDEA